MSEQFPIKCSILFMLLGASITLPAQRMTYKKVEPSAKNNLSRSTYAQLEPEAELKKKKVVYNNRAREYDAQLRRFLSPDKLKEQFGAYTYVENDPVSKVDPTGNCNKCSAGVNEVEYGGMFIEHTAQEIAQLDRVEQIRSACAVERQQANQANNAIPLEDPLADYTRMFPLVDPGPNTIQHFQTQQANPNLTALEVREILVRQELGQMWNNPNLIGSPNFPNQANMQNSDATLWTHVNNQTNFLLRPLNNNGIPNGDYSHFKTSGGAYAVNSGGIMVRHQFNQNIFRMNANGVAVRVDGVTPIAAFPNQLVDADFLVRQGDIHYFIDNGSGHYKPNFESLSAIGGKQYFANSLGVNENQIHFLNHQAMGISLEILVGETLPGQSDVLVNHIMYSLTLDDVFHIPNHLLPNHPLNLNGANYTGPQLAQLRFNELFQGNYDQYGVNAYWDNSDYIIP